MKAVFSFLFIACFCSAFAQTIKPGPPIFLREVFSTHIDPKPWAGIEGSPFVTDRWLLARIKTEGRAELIDSLPIKINVFSNGVHFINETEVKLTDNQRNIRAQYQLEKDASKTVLMKLTFEDKTFSFPGSNEPMKLTYTYRIRGIDENRLLLETPRQYKYRPVVLLMKKK